MEQEALFASNYGTSHGRKCWVCLGKRVCCLRKLTSDAGPEREGKNNYKRPLIDGSERLSAAAFTHWLLRPAGATSLGQAASCRCYLANVCQMNGVARANGRPSMGRSSIDHFARVLVRPAPALVHDTMVEEAGEREREKEKEKEEEDARKKQQPLPLSKLGSPGRASVRNTPTLNAGKALEMTVQASLSDATNIRGPFVRACSWPMATRARSS